MPVILLRSVALAAGLACLSGAAAFAEPTFAPVELAAIAHSDGMLRVIAADGTETTYSTDELETLPTFAIETTTPWDSEPLRFEGVMLADVLARHGLAGTDIEVLAENDYVTAIEAEVAATGDFMIATRVDGHPLSRRERGPLLFVVPSTSLVEGGPVGERHLVWMAAEIRPLG